MYAPEVSKTEMNGKNEKYNYLEFVIKCSEKYEILSSTESRLCAITIHNLVVFAKV